MSIIILELPVYNGIIMSLIYNLLKLIYNKISIIVFIIGLIALLRVPLVLAEGPPPGADHTEWCEQNTDECSEWCAENEEVEICQEPECD